MFKGGYDYWLFCRLSSRFSQLKIIYIASKTAVAGFYQRNIRDNWGLKQIALDPGRGLSGRCQQKKK